MEYSCNTLSSLTGKCERVCDEGIESKFREICRDSGGFKSVDFMTGLLNSLRGGKGELKFRNLGLFVLQKSNIKDMHLTRFFFVY